MREGWLGCEFVSLVFFDPQLRLLLKPGRRLPEFFFTILLNTEFRASNVLFC